MNDRQASNLKLICAIFISILVAYFLFASVDVRSFFNDVENKTFDIRQRLMSKYKTPNKDIIILAVEDQSYEYIITTYGAWPAPRDFWAKIANGVSEYNPRALVFDLLFVQNFKAFGNSDTKLVDAIKGKKNIYLSMTFDNQNPEIRKPIELPSSLETKVEGREDLLKKIPYLNYTNVRSIIQGLLYGTDKIGFINIKRDSDGIARSKLPVFRYKDKYYKQLTTLVGMDMLGLDSKKIKVDPSGNILLSDKVKLPLTKDGKVYLNWYGPALTYKYVPVWEVDKAINSNNSKFLKETFENKIVYVGTASSSMSDIKPTPMSPRHPGVEMHATYLNNILDNNLIQKTNLFFDILVCLFLAGLTFIAIKQSKSVLFAIINVLVIIAAYLFFASLIMHFCNLWVQVVYPILASVMTLGLVYIVKYIITSRDYEHTYKLAVTDGLTEMYNHRYFQEQMKLNIENSKRYNTEFSLIMVDIDFFKKFNDKHGHQSGDAVLRQVAQTIRRNIRATDIPCRYGGEEMAVILANTSKKDASIVAQKICEAVRAREFELADGSYTHVTISLGVSTMPKDGITPEEMIEYADKCLYIAKENGRNQAVFEVES